MIETIILGCVFVVGGVGLGLTIGLVLHKLSDLAKRVQVLEAVNNQLQDCKQKRLPYNTAAGVEDALAVGIDLARHYSEIKLELDAIQARMERQAEILRAVRGGPDGYDPDKAAGLRK